MIDYLNYGKQVQSIPKEPQSEIKVSTPKNLGWLEYKLNQTELDYVWGCVNQRKERYNSQLVGNISDSYLLEDKNNWFYNNTIIPLIDQYEISFKDLGKTVTSLELRSDDSKFLSYLLKSWWVNRQKQYEFNPCHHHKGVYSFVIWLKIPYEWEEQNKDNESSSKSKGVFRFLYQNLHGEINYSEYRLGKKYEGTMLFFPSKLDHLVYPFYNCEEDRISVSGNILLQA